MARTNFIAARLATDLQRDFDLSYEQALGVVGNLAHESGGFGSLQEKSPLVPGSRGGYGYAQWTGDRRRSFERYARDNNLDPASYEANYGFLKHEIETDPYERKQFMKVKQAKTADEAARIVSKNYLRPGIPHMDSRLAWTEELAGVANNPALAAIDTATAPTPLPAPNRMSFRADAPVPEGQIDRSAVPPIPASPDARVTARNRVAAATPDYIPRVDAPIMRPDLADVGPAMATPGAPAGDFSFSMPEDMPPSPMPTITPFERARQNQQREYGDLNSRLDAMPVPERSAPPPPWIRPTTPDQIEAGSGFRVTPPPAPMTIADVYRQGGPTRPGVPMPGQTPYPMPRPGVPGLQTGIAPKDYIPRPMEQQRAFGMPFQLPGRLGMLQTMAGSAVNPSGIERRQINTAMHNLFNPGIQSSQAVRDEARRTGNHSTLKRGDRTYDPDTNSWRVK